MPTDKPENHEDTTPEKPVTNSQSPIAGGEPQNSSEEQVRTDQADNHEKHRNKPHIIRISKIPKIDVIEGVEANRIAKRANWISFGTAIVNFLLFGCTVILATISIRQANSADHAATTADKTYRADSSNNEHVFENQKILQRKIDSSDKIKSKHEDSVFNYQKKSLNAQIASINETKNEFDLENRPFLQVTDISIDTSKADEIEGSFRISNTGKQPAQIITAKITSGDTHKYFPYDESKLIEDKAIEGLHISNIGYGMNFIHSGFDNYAKFEANNVKKGNGYVYIMGHITYKSPISNKIHETIFYYKITYMPSYNANAIREDYK